ncbi:MerR family transcriptional regulator [Pendulispora albinea]|uniref:MerR family transcriptional regulator n=1 Tax=Pendulispora albinea TaxID=2741071 RepID=A0ABZ2MA54_9BACT
MLSIGAFSRLTGLSIKALRLYDASHLLRPAEVDPKTGYRRYRLTQISDAHRILALRQMGMPLGDMESGGRDHASLLTLRRALEARMETLVAQLAAVDEALTGRAPTPAVVVKSIPAMRVIAHRRTLAKQHETDAMLGELCGAHPSTLSGTVWHDCGSRTGRVDAEVFVLSPNRASNGVVFPAAASASCLIPEDDVDSGYRAVSRWLRRGTHRQIGPYREIYYRDETDNAWVEIQLPITRSRA